MPKTFPPLPGTQWAYEVVSVTVPYNSVVDIYMTDVLLKGDVFEIYEVNGVAATHSILIGTTPWVPQGPNPDPTMTSNPDVAWNDPTYSHGKFTWSLSAGTHYFAIRAATSPWGIGGAYIKFCPETAISCRRQPSTQK